MHSERILLGRIVNTLRLDNPFRSIRRIVYFNSSLFDTQFNRTTRSCLDIMSMSVSNSDNARHGVLPICWHCGKKPTRAPTDDAVAVMHCSHCGRLQPLPPRVDFFSYLGLGDPAGATIDGQELKRRFRRMQSLVHPDKFVGRDEHERGLSEQHSTFLNNAYRTLREPFARAEYLLSLLEMVKSEVASSSADTFPSEEETVQDDAMAAEMMELMESIERMEPNNSTQIGQRLEELDQEIYRLLRRANDQMIAQDIPGARQTMRRISYLRRSRGLLEAKRNGGQ